MGSRLVNNVPRKITIHRILRTNARIRVWALKMKIQLLPRLQKYNYLVYDKLQPFQNYLFWWLIFVSKEKFRLKPPRLAAGRLLCFSWDVDRVIPMFSVDLLDEWLPKRLMFNFSNYNYICSRNLISKFCWCPLYFILLNNYCGGVGDIKGQKLVVVEAFYFNWNKIKVFQYIFVPYFDVLNTF